MIARPVFLYPLLYPDQLRFLMFIERPGVGDGDFATPRVPSYEFGMGALF